MLYIICTQTFLLRHISRYQTTCCINTYVLCLDTCWNEAQEACFGTVIIPLSDNVLANGPFSMVGYNEICMYV